MLHEEFSMITVHISMITVSITVIIEKSDPELAADYLFKHMQLLLLKVYANEISGEACDPRNRAVNPYFELLNPGNIQKNRNHPKNG